MLDYDECANNDDNKYCNDNAVCHNMNGTYWCVCKPGFTGHDGRTCTGTVDSSYYVAPNYKILAV